MNFSNKVALVTGAGSGIGRALAQALAREGATVCLVGRRAEKLAESANAHPAMSIFSADISATMEVEELIENIIQQHGRLDFLINNAGVFPAKKSVADTSVTDWDRAFATNVRGPFLLTRAVLPHFQAQSYGRIVNISAPIKHLPQAAAYCASKCALDSLTKTTAFELRGTNILINAVEPPFCDTEMHAGGKSPEVVIPAVFEFLAAEAGGATGRIVKIE
jgi:NAD(P)-dependent dehydrogenase (short-subunit alcohol dehydrogenase family)